MEDKSYLNMVKDSMSQSSVNATSKTRERKPSQWLIRSTIGLFNIKVSWAHSRQTPGPKAGYVLAGHHGPWAGDLPGLSARTQLLATDCEGFSSSQAGWPDEEAAPDHPEPPWARCDVCYWTPRPLKTQRKPAPGFLSLQRLRRRKIHNVFC